MVHARWSDTREEHIERIGREAFEAGKKQMLADARRWRLAEIRRRRGRNSGPNSNVGPTMS